MSNKKVVFVTTHEDDFVMEADVEQLKSGEWERFKDVTQVLYASTSKGLTMGLSKVEGKDHLKEPVYRKYLDLNTANIIAIKELDEKGSLYRAYKATTSNLILQGNQQVPASKVIQ